MVSEWLFKYDQIIRFIALYDFMGGQLFRLGLRDVFSQQFCFFFKSSLCIMA